MFSYYLEKDHPLFEKNHLFLKSILLEIPFQESVAKAVKEILKQGKITQDEFTILYPNKEKDLIIAIIDHILIQTEEHYYQEKESYQGIKGTLHGLMLYQFRLYPNMGLIFSRLFPKAIAKGIFYNSHNIWTIVDRLWYLAGDTATDWNFYSKRILLSHIYSEALLFSMQDSTKDYRETSDFIYRAFERIKFFEKLKKLSPNLSPLKEKIISFLGKVRYRGFQPKL